MNELSKEQAEWLISSFKSLTAGKIFPVEPSKLDAFVEGWRAAELNLQLMIDKCTEKEFPKFECPYGSGLKLTVSGNAEDILFNMNYNNYTFGMHPNDFKILTTGCASVCKWLDDNTDKT